MGPVEGYAAALYNVARAEDALDRVSDELYQIARLLESNSELMQRLTDARMDTAARIGIVEELLSGRAHPQTVSAVTYVLSSGRARQLPEIADALAKYTAASRKRAVADVRTAVPLDDEARRRLAEALSRSTGREVEVKATVDPDVVGGVVVTMGDTVIDGSVARRLAELRARLVGV